MDEPAGEPHVDLHDYRGRLARLALAAAIAGVLTVVLMGWIRSVSKSPNSDPVGGSMVGLVAICVFVMLCAVMVRVIAAIERRRASRPPGD